MAEQSTTEKKNFERINYSLRPAKHIERKMFCETFGRLSILDNIKNYRYLGMGSAYFSDFSLFHKALGLTKLLSIEGEDDARTKARIRFNQPFACINLEFGMTHNVLPRLPWAKWQEKSIVWLDYVDRLKEVMFADIDTVLFNVRPGSVFLISVNIEEDDYKNKDLNPHGLSAKEFRFNQLIKSVGKDAVPLRASDLLLNIKDNKSIVREIIDTAFRGAVRKRNSGVAEAERVEYRQLFNLHYKDSADMLTVGGIIYTKDQKTIVGEMFRNLDFIRTGNQCFSIVVPKLTYREILALDEALPAINKNKTGKKSGKARTTKRSGRIDLDKLPLSSIDKKNYERIYRYFPTFAETNL
jgi:hypothetical protein